MNCSGEYQRRAAEADAKADATSDLQLKRSWSECAQSWRLIAERAAHVEREAKLSPDEPANDH